MNLWPTDQPCYELVQFLYVAVTVECGACCRQWQDIVFNIYNYYHSAIECEPLLVIANGVITYAPDNVSNYSLGITATYSCSTGFSLDLSTGSETRTCVDDGDNDAEGVFNGHAPTCVRKSTQYTLLTNSSAIQISIKFKKDFYMK